MEDTVKGAPDAGELAQVTELVRATKADLDVARAQVSELQAEVTRLGLKADAQQGRIESQTLEIQVKNRRVAELEAAKRTAEHQVRELIASSQDHQKNKEAEVKLATRRGKKEVAEAYNKILISVKEKFSKKKEEVDLLIYAQELQANTDLLKELLANEIQSAEEEYNRLMAAMPDAVAAYERAQVSDFSVSKLPLPQISESSGIFEINMFNPSFSGEYGSNLGSMGPGSAPADATLGGSGREIGGGASADEQEPGDGDQGAEKDLEAKDD